MNRWMLDVLGCPPLCEVRSGRDDDECVLVKLPPVVSPFCFLFRVIVWGDGLSLVLVLSLLKVLSLSFAVRCTVAQERVLLLLPLLLLLVCRDG